MIERNDALSLEYKLMYGCATGEMNVSDIVNNPVGLGVAWISGYGFEKQLPDFLNVQVRSATDDISDLSLVG